MAEGLSVAVLNAWLNSLCRGAAYTPPVALYAKFHTGAPGSAGTANAAANTTRQQATFSVAASASITTSADITWTAVPNAETYTHVSFWDSATGGAFLGSDALDAPKTVDVGSNVVISAGSLTISIAPLAV